jgi:hypothetical protein
MGSLEFFYQHTLHENWQNVVSPIHSAKDLLGVTLCKGLMANSPFPRVGLWSSKMRMHHPKKNLKINSKSNIFHGKSRRYEAGGFEPSISTSSVCSLTTTPHTHIPSYPIFIFLYYTTLSVNCFFDTLNIFKFKSYKLQNFNNFLRSTTFILGVSPFEVVSKICLIRT